MSACPNTGISTPECSCRACLTALLQTHMPSLLERRAQQAAAHPQPPDVRRLSEQQRRAA
jgi:hypothetical protein